MFFTISPAPGAPAVQDGTLVVVEGYMDVIALAQAGIENAVAPLGTALTENQLKLIWRVTPQPVLCFDGDEAGQRAANRTADLALAADRTGPVAALRGAAAGQGSGRSGASGRARAI
jgi:DNA primase